MTEFIKNLIGNDALATIIMSLVPLIELKGGIVFARGVGLNFLYSLCLAYLGSTIVFIPIYFLLRPILNLIKKVKLVGKLAYKVENYFKVKAEDTLKKQEQKKKGKSFSEAFLKALGVFIFVAIPLPMTGVWTGTAIAVFLNLKFKDVILPVAVGNMVAGLIISVLAEICATFWTLKSLDYILYGLFILAIILLVVVTIKVVRQKPKQQTDSIERKE